MPFNNDRSLKCDVTSYSDFEGISAAVTYMLLSVPLVGNARVNSINLRFLITELLRTIRVSNEHYLAIPFNNNAWNFCKLDRIQYSYNPNNLSRKIVYIAKKLSEYGYVSIVDGYRERAQGLGDGRITRLKPTDKFKREVYERYGLKYAKIKRHKDSALVILKDSNKNLVSYSYSSDVQRMHDTIKTYNCLLANTSVEIEHRLVCNNVSINNNSVFRVFNNSSFENGGRFYGAWWQAISGINRRYIKINNEDTVELDFEAQIVRTLYGMSNSIYDREQQGDPYMISGWEGEDNRALIKKIISISINATHERQAIEAVNDWFISEFRDKEIYQILNGSVCVNTYRRAVNDIFNKHPILRDKFYTRAGFRTMNVDSLVCETVIKTMTDMRIPVLTIHDSFIVQKRHKEILRGVMERAYFVNDLGNYLPRIREEG